MAIKGGAITSIAKMKAALKRGSGAGFIKNIPAGEDLTVRFLTEPDKGWFSYIEHYDEGENRFYPCGDDCPGCADGVRGTQRYLANAIDIENNNEVIAIKLPTTLVEILMDRYDKYQTIMDRDYELSRTGSGKNTRYMAVPMAPKTRRLKQYDLLDLGEILEAQMPIGDSDEEDEAPPPRTNDKTKAEIRRRLQKARRSVDEDDDEDDDPPPRRLTKPGQNRREKEAATRRKPINSQPARRPRRPR